MEKLQTQHSLSLAQREAQHWKWRAGLLQLQAAGRDEVLELGRVLLETTAAECASTRARLEELACGKAELQAGVAVHTLPLGVKRVQPQH